MSVNVRDVAKAAKVSVGTVSNVLNRPDVVAPSTLSRVQKTIKELGFVPNGFARQLRSGVSRTLGLVVPDVGNPFFTEVARGVEDAARKRDYAVFLCNSDESLEKEDRYINVLIEQHVRGVLITPADIKADRIDALRARGICVTLLDREVKGDNQCSVSVDDVHGGQIAIEYLVSLGHQRIAWVSGPTNIPQVADRGAGVAKAARIASVEIEHIKVPLMNTANGEEAAHKLLSLDSLPTAVFCANDLLALGVMRELLNQGIRIPDQIAILGYDDIQFAPSAAVPLSSISQPAYQIGVTAADLILSECESDVNHEHQQIKFQPRLVERASTIRAKVGKNE
jgi:LacI family transcriptional regulator